MIDIQTNKPSLKGWKREGKVEKEKAKNNSTLMQQKFIFVF